MEIGVKLKGEHGRGEMAQARQESRRNGVVSRIFFASRINFASRIFIASGTRKTLQISVWRERLRTRTRQDFEHTHDFTVDTSQNEKNTLRVVLLTALMMVAEILGGWYFNSMALMADGFHMGTHALALGVTLLAYWYARRHARNPAFTFGTGKVSDLGGYTSAILLLVAALIMAVESLERLFNPVGIGYNEAIMIASLGLMVNLASAWILRDNPNHQHEHGEGEEHADHEHHTDHTPRDRNIKAAYLHVLADALTSVLAILALFAGKTFGWSWMDPVMGVVGAVVITRWSLGLIGETSQVLLDRSVNVSLMEHIRERLESEANVHVCDLHVWAISPERYAVTVTLLVEQPRDVEYYKEILSSFPKVVHTTVELNTCEGA